MDGLDRPRVAARPSTMKDMSVHAHRHTPSDDLRETWENLSRLILALCPTAQVVNIYVDDSHDDPHGHIHTILDASGETLIDARGEWWQTTNDTILIDEAAYDWFVDYSAANPDQDFPGGMVIAVPIGD